MGDATSRWSEREVLEFDGLRIETNARRVFVDGAEVALTKTEFDLLVVLAGSAGNLVTSAQIFEQVWGTDWFGDGHAVEVQISRLRRKLGESIKSPRFITTIRGSGYRFDAASREDFTVITYDDQLRIADIRPRDRPFLGWDPLDLIGTFRLFSTGPEAHIPQAVALEVFQMQAKLGPMKYSLEMSLRCADGSVIQRSVQFEILTNADGELSGVVASIL